MAIRKTSLPVGSLLQQQGGELHFVESYEGDFSDPGGRVGSVEIGRLFFSSGPRWVGRLFALRNAIVGPLGLKASGISRENLAQFRCQPGDKVGLFKVMQRTPQEVILGEDDRHLDFRVSLFLSPAGGPVRTLTVSTTVHFHNRWGRLYFFPVKPFHRRLVPAMLRSMLENLQGQQP